MFGNCQSCYFRQVLHGAAGASLIRLSSTVFWEQPPDSKQQSVLQKYALNMGPKSSRIAGASFISNLCPRGSFISPASFPCTEGRGSFPTVWECAAPRGSCRRHFHTIIAARRRGMDARCHTCLCSAAFTFHSPTGPQQSLPCGTQSVGWSVWLNRRRALWWESK